MPAILFVPCTKLHVLEFRNLNLLTKHSMNIQLEKKSTMILLLLVVANYCFWRMH